MVQTVRELPTSSSEDSELRNSELTSPHSISSSAVARSVGGMLRPSALAVLRLITSSK